MAELSLRWAQAEDAQAIASLEVKSLAFEIRSDRDELLNEQDLTSLWHRRLSLRRNRVILAFAKDGNAQDHEECELKEDFSKDKLSKDKVPAYSQRTQASGIFDLSVREKPSSSLSLSADTTDLNHADTIALGSASLISDPRDDDEHVDNNAYHDGRNAELLPKLRYSQSHLASPQLRHQSAPTVVQDHTVFSHTKSMLASAKADSSATTSSLPFEKYSALKAEDPKQVEALVGFIALTEPLVLGRIASLYIHPSFMRQGIGSLLINTTAKLVALKQGHKLYVKVQMCNKGAILFYETLHFRAYAVKSSNQKNLITMMKEF